MKDDPFLMNVTLPDGTFRFEGFCVDLLKKIVEIYPFKYRIQLVKDGNYGTLQRNGKWDGMIGEVMYGVSHSYMYKICYLRPPAPHFCPFMLYYLFIYSLI